MSFIFTKPTENIANIGSITLATGTADTNNPLANLTSGDPTESFFTTDSIGIAVTWDRTSATRVDMISIPIHGIPAGEDVRFQMHATDSWGTPSLDAAVTLNAYTEFPDVILVDLTGVSGYLAGGYRWNRLFVPNHGGITKIGDIGIWSTKNTLLSALRVNTPVRPNARKVTPFTMEDGSDFFYDHLQLQRSISGSFQVSPVDFATLLDLWEIAKGPVLPFMVQQSSSHEGQYSRWMGGLKEKELESNITNFPVTFKEVGRGSPL